MTAIELLDTLRAVGVALWVQQGKLHLFASRRDALTTELQQAARQHSEALARIIRTEYVCWRCESSNVRFDTDLRRYVCDDCRRVLSDPLDSFPPLPELLLQTAEAYGFPELRILPHVSIRAGREAWRAFCFAPMQTDHLLITAYRRLLYPAEPVDIAPTSESKPQTEEGNEHMKIRWTTAEPLPTGEYPVRVESVNEQEGKYGVQLVWKLRVLAPEHEGKELTAWTNTTTSTNSKLARWAQSLGFEPEPGEELDTNDLIGRKAIAVVVVKRAEDGSIFNRVEDLLPLRKPARAKVAVPADSDPFADDYEA
jgi:DNA-directed RNA polymerase subunit RPC12/RpoP